MGASNIVVDNRYIYILYIYTHVIICIFRWFGWYLINYADSTSKYMSLAIKLWINRLLKGVELQFLAILMGIFTSQLFLYVKGL